MNTEPNFPREELFEVPAPFGVRDNRRASATAEKMSRGVQQRPACTGTPEGGDLHTVAKKKKAKKSKKSKK